ncbi:TonB-dependent receptor domain-containing protein [Xanthomonas arboricola pv. corylina]|nr:TonB-dependent receptor [Xanthomonas arboricola]PPU06809.1 TonB-dependent receptor [Xanthomonas arboricola pv. corylina]PPU56790.1 TonB-dependent receptor [Xanthomonas arboricola pv. corylina]QUI82621.1 TonB-dependent receptor [Xanthomonas arboricola pv. corylina]CAE6781424.1 Vitamin B12 transporter BtuB [Xanthomonas arboricola pv. corylina]CAE6781439.1 Vitamin B12 transporter BtuB [Xanthomonas arboricola pv. corylina]
MSHTRLSLAAAVSAALSLSAHAQGPATDLSGIQTPSAKTLDSVSVVGSQIQGGSAAAALQVTSLDRQQVDATGATGGDELYRTIPQMGDVSFNPTNGAASSNFSRGDVGSVDLRGLGVGNTLMLLNGRRTVVHPGSQAARPMTNLVPVLTYNANAIPVAGVSRVEVLRDGASAIYGSDAVGGVVNNVLQNNLLGGWLELRYGGAESTSLRQSDISGAYGWDFRDGRGNVSVFLNQARRSDLPAGDLDYAASSDKRPLFESTRFEGVSSLDMRNTLSAWADLAVPSSFGRVTRNGNALTSAAGAFHIQPNTNDGCAAPLAEGLCVDDGARATAGADRNLRYDSATYPLSLLPSLVRRNVFVTGHYALNDDVEAYGELGWYQADTRALQGPVFTIGSTKVTIPAGNYWNPFGATTLPDGSPNPNRISGLNIPTSGLPVTLNNYRFMDLGPTLVKVENTQARILGGLRGYWNGWDWDSALLYSQAQVVDRQDGISSTALQRQLALSTPDAYNPFNGGDLLFPATGGDATPSGQAAQEAIRVASTRRSRTTLALGDFKLSRTDLLQLPGGDVGAAAGIEFRRETQLDDRDARVDGSLGFVDAVTGEVQTADLFGVSPTPDTRGSRNVWSAYVELAAPLVSPEMEVPLVRSLDVQLAGRFERYSDFGNVAKPKIAVAWEVFDDFRVRGSWSEGFRASNLEQVNASLVTRGNTRTDWVLCEADLRAGRISSFANCSRSGVATAQRSGNPDLDPEESTSWTDGLLWTPGSARLGRFSFSADYWSVEQTGIIGLFGEGNALILDYLLRTQGSSNPNVIRAAPTADDAAAAAGTELAPVGTVIYVKDQYVNLRPQTVRGLDFNASWQKGTDRAGTFKVDLSATRLLEFYRDPSPEIAALIAARDAGQLNAGTSISGGGDLIGQNGTPEWKGSGSLTWQCGKFTTGAFMQYVGAVDDTGLIDSSGRPWRVDATTTGSLYVQYAFGRDQTAGTRVRLGVRNLTDETPPLAATASGYLGTLYEPYGRYWYASVRHAF